MNLIEDRQRQDVADTGDRSQPVKGVTVMPLGLPDDRQLEVGDEIVVAFEEREVHVNALTDTGISERLAHASAIRRIREALAEFGQLILGPRVLDLCQELAALPRASTT